MLCGFYLGVANTANIPLGIRTSLQRILREYFGLVKCSVLPPRTLYHPVLPYRTHGKLMFPLCRTCADTLQQEPCCHNDSERALWNVGHPGTSKGSGKGLPAAQNRRGVALPRAH